MDDGSVPPRSLFSKLASLFGKEEVSLSTFEDDISALLGQGENSGAIGSSISQMIQNVVDFSDTQARQIMTPRIDVVAIEQSCPLREVIDVMVSEGYSRLPIYAEDMDHIIGFIVGKDLLQFWGADLDSPLPKDILRPITLVHGNKKIGDILSRLRNRKSHLAIVLDEYGGTAGIVTLEDIIEEIVGDISDEFDEDETLFKDLSPGITLAVGQAPIDDLSEHLGTELPEGDYDTLGGFLTNQVGLVPQAGEQVIWGDIIFKIVAADDRKVERVEISKSGPSQALPTEG